MIVSSQRWWFGDKKLLETVIIGLTCNLGGHKRIIQAFPYTSHTLLIQPKSTKRSYHNVYWKVQCLLFWWSYIYIYGFHALEDWWSCFEELGGQFSRPVSRQLSTIWNVNSLCPHPSEILVRCCSHTTLIHESFMCFPLKMDNELLSSR